TRNARRSAAFRGLTGFPRQRASRVAVLRNGQGHAPGAWLGAPGHGLNPAADRDVRLLASLPIRRWNAQTVARSRSSTTTIRRRQHQGPEQTGRWIDVATDRDEQAA